MQNDSWLDVRERRLEEDWRRLRELSSESSLISPEAIFGEPPEAFRIRFNCRGVTELGPDGPIFGDHHEVEIQLPINYPSSPPRLRWLSPIFHPNINREGTEVCLAVWYPSKFLDEVCIMLGKMIQYRNFDHTSPLRLDAALWAKSNGHLLPVDIRSFRSGSPSGADYSRPFEIIIH